MDEFRTLEEKKQWYFENRGRGKRRSATAERLDVPLEILEKWARQADSARKRKWENRNRAKCVRCGRPRGAGSSRSKGKAKLKNPLCLQCVRDRRACRAVAMMRIRNELGLSTIAIARILNLPRNTVTDELSRLRGAGYLVKLDPYAQKMGIQIKARQDRSSRALKEVLMKYGVMPAREAVVLPEKPQPSRRPHIHPMVELDSPYEPAVN